MAITVQKRPDDRCWSGNPMLYQLYSAAAEAAPANFFEIAVWFKRSDDADYAEVVRFPYYPVSGSAKIDVHSIIHRKLEYQLPNLTTGLVYENQLFSNKMTGWCYIKLREITVADANPAWQTESSHARFVVKGGISFEKWRGDNYWANYFDTEKPFLTWQKSGRLASLEERMYLAWLNLTDVVEGNTNMRRKLVFTDGTEDYAFIDLGVKKYNVVYFPCGASQLKLDEVDNTKQIWYWELQVFDVTDLGALVAVSTVHKFELDNRKDYNAITLNYRNSLGGLDSVQIRGAIEYNLERDFTQQDRVVLADYWIYHFISPRRIAVDSTELQVYKGDAGFTDKENQDRLRDIHLQRECWWEQQSKWLPVMLLTGNQKLRSSDDKKWHMPVEFAVASGGDNFYTPRSIDLQEGSGVNTGVCDADIDNATYLYVPGLGWTVDWDLLSGTPAKYLISTPGVNGGIPAEAGSNTYLFPWLPVGDNVITITPVCLVGSDYFNGTPIQVTITVTSTCTGVTIASTTPAYPYTATATVPFSATVVLAGTAPFALTVQIKPDWMTITLLGDTVTLAGTPDFIDAGDPQVIKYKVSNCLYNNNQLILTSVTTYV